MIQDQQSLANLNNGIVTTAGSANTVSNTGIGITTTIVDAESISFQIENEGKNYKNFINKTLQKIFQYFLKNKSLNNGKDFN